MELVGVYLVASDRLLNLLDFMHELTGIAWFRLEVEDNKLFIIPIMEQCIFCTRLATEEFKGVRFCLPCKDEMLKLDFKKKRRKKVN